MNKKCFLTLATAVMLLAQPLAAAAQDAPDAEIPGMLKLKALPTEEKLSSKLPRKLAAEPRKTVANTADIDGRTIYGAMINSTEWNNASITSVPYGIYSFEAGASIKPQSHITGLSYNFQGGAYGMGKFFGISAMNIMGVLNGAHYVTIDTDKWAEVKDVMYGTENKSYSLLPSAMAYNPVDNTIYSLQYNDDLTGLDWCVYNPKYDEMDKIAAFRGKYNVLTLAAMPDGSMYFINSYGDLYTINRKNGRPAFVGMTGITPTLYAQSMMYDNRTGKFLWAAQTVNGSEMYAVDPITAEAERVAVFTHNEQFTALWTANDEALDGAPARVEDLKLDYDGDGGLNGTISFSVPTTKYGGASLGEATLYVWLDGEIIKEGNVTAGSAVQVPVSLTEGNHYVAVNLKNGEGYSPLACIYQYAGYDTPMAVSDLLLTSDETTGKNTVKWTAPTGGVNGGYIDFANLTYTVVRMPDNVTVAEGLKNTTFSEDIPAVMNNYSYRVSAVNNGKAGAYAETEKILCGDAFTVPYYQSFADAGVFENYFTVIDANEDGITWRKGYSTEVRFDLTGDNAKGDDWLITPEINLEGGTRYRFTMNMKTFTSGYPEDFNIYVGTAPDDLSTFKLVKEVTGLELYETFSDYNAEFNIETSGKYYVAVRYLSETAKNGSMMMINSMAVDKLGATKAPAPVTGLTLTAGADDAMTATVAFTAPTENLEGVKLAKIDRINVYRKDKAEPLHVFSAPTPGTQLSWTDNSVEEVGMNAYTIVAENEYGAGASVADSVFVGVYSAPYLETFDTRSASELYKSTITGIDTGSNPYNVWKYDENSKKMTYYSSVPDASTTISTWLYTPKFKLDANSVYAFTYKTNINLYLSDGQEIINAVYMGADQESGDMQTKVGDMPTSTQYKLADVSHQVVTTGESKVYFGFSSVSKGQWAYNSVEIDDVGLTYLKSAYSPYMFTGYAAAAANDGSLRADLTFTAPETDYHGNRLTDNLKVEIFRGQSPTPVFTKEYVVPGAKMSWTDANAQHGENVYMLVASNSYGRSEVYTDTLFVGRDVPAVVANYSGHGSNDNLSAVLTWDIPAEGVNGGVIIPSEISYNVYAYNPDDNSLTPIKTGIKETNYNVETSGLEEQEVRYYAVSAVNTEGEGQATALALTVGPLYKLPYRESFANMEAQTSPWQLVGAIPPYITWGTDNPTGEGTYAVTPQDNDGGLAYMYNGNQYETYTGVGFISPKVAIGGETSTLKFWLYGIPTAYPDNKPAVMVYVSADDAPYEPVGEYVVGSDTENGWKQYEVSLQKYGSASFLSFAFYGFTAGYMDVIYLDNIAIERGLPSSINDVEADAKEIKDVRYYDAAGRRVNPTTRGIVIRSTTYIDGTTKSEKIINK